MSRIDTALRRAAAHQSPNALVPVRARLAPAPVQGVAAPEDYASEDGGAAVVAARPPDAVLDERAFAPEPRPAPVEGGTALVPGRVSPPPDLRPRAADSRSAIVRPSVGTLVTEPGIAASSVEQYRRVAATLHHLQREEGIRRLMVASALPREGKTLTCVNLALTIATAYRHRVLIIDGDLRKPSVHTFFGIPQEGGLSRDLLTSDAPLRLIEVAEGVTVLPAGRPEPNATVVLASHRMRAVVEDASQQFDWVILDSSPIGVITDASLLAPLVDAILLVVGAGVAPCHKVQNAVEALGRDRIVGTVLNRVDDRQLDLTQDQGYYYYYNGPEVDPA